LEVTTTPLPQFDKTLVFYERKDFTIIGSRELKAALKVASLIHHSSGLRQHLPYNLSIMLQENPDETTD